MAGITRKAKPGHDVESRSQAIRLADDRNASLLLRFLCRAQSDRQLQHRRMLTFTERMDPHKCSIGKLKRVVMCMRIVHFDLPEPSSSDR